MYINLQLFHNLLATLSLTLVPHSSQNACTSVHRPQIRHDRRFFSLAPPPLRLCCLVIIITASTRQGIHTHTHSATTSTSHGFWRARARAIPSRSHEWNEWNTYTHSLVLVRAQSHATRTITRRSRWRKCTLHHRAATNMRGLWVLESARKVCRCFRARARDGKHSQGSTWECTALAGSVGQCVHDEGFTNNVMISHKLS